MIQVTYTVSNSKLSEQQVYTGEWTVARQRALNCITAWLKGDNTTGDELTKDLKLSVSKFSLEGIFLKLEIRKDAETVFQLEILNGLNPDGAEMAERLNKEYLAISQCFGEVDYSNIQAGGHIYRFIKLPRILSFKITHSNEK